MADEAYRMVLRAVVQSPEVSNWGDLVEMLHPLLRRDRGEGFLEGWLRDSSHRPS